jgi:hypothetical protein
MSDVTGYAVALRVNDVCHCLRMHSAPTAADQKTCDAQQAFTASALYGSDPAKEGRAVTVPGTAAAAPRTARHSRRSRPRA